MKPARIVNNGGGPRIEGTRITVYAILEYLRAGQARDYIAANLFISSAQVEAAMEYIREHEAEVNAEFERIMARIRHGNPPEIEAKLEASRKKLKELREDPKKFEAWCARPADRQELSSDMFRITSDNDILGQVSRLVDMCQSAEWVEFWRELDCVVYTFDQLGLAADASDFAVWEACQANNILLITANRSAIDPDSLELAIRQRNRADSLPVLTLADADRVLRDREYANSVVERLFEILLDIDLVRGTGRLFLP